MTLRNGIDVDVGVGVGVGVGVDVFTWLTCLLRFSKITIIIIRIGLIGVIDWGVLYGNSRLGELDRWVMMRTVGFHPRTKFTANSQFQAILSQIAILEYNDSQ